MPRMSQITGVFVIALAGLFACRTAPLGAPARIPVPANVSTEDAEIAIVAMLTAGEQPAASHLSDPNTHTIVLASPIGAMLLDSYRNRPASKGWFVESWNPGRITAGYQRGPHYLRVLIDLQGRDVILRIADSKNLDQSRGRIHENALAWVDRLEINIRDALGQASLHVENH